MPYLRTVLAGVVLGLLSVLIEGCATGVERSPVRTAASARADTAFRTPDEWVQLGNQLYNNHRWPEARDAYLAALELEPERPSVLADLGVAYWNLGEIESARASFEGALRLDPAHWQALYNLVIVFAEGLEDPVGAADLLDRLKRLRSERPEAEIPDLSALETSVRRGLEVEEED